MDPFSITNTPTYFSLKSERLQLRAVTAADVPFWKPFFEDAPYIKYLVANPNIDAYTFASDWVNRQIKRYTENGFGHLAVCLKTGEFIGMSGLIPRYYHGAWHMELAYSFLPQYWGKGYASEACATLLDFAEQQNQGLEVMSMIHPDNEPSIQLAFRNGMKYSAMLTYEEMEVKLFVHPQITF